MGLCENFSSQGVSESYQPHLPHLLGSEDSVFWRCEHSQSLRDSEILCSSACTPIPDKRHFPFCHVPGTGWSTLCSMMTTGPLPTVYPHSGLPGCAFLFPLPGRHPAEPQPRIPGQMLVPQGGPESTCSRSFMFCTCNFVFVCSFNLTWLLTRTPVLCPTLPHFPEGTRPTHSCYFWCFFPYFLYMLMNLCLDVTPPSVLRIC